MRAEGKLRRKPEATFISRLPAATVGKWHSVP